MSGKRKAIASTHGQVKRTADIIELDLPDALSEPSAQTQFAVGFEWTSEERLIPSLSGKRPR
jgi:hypothetical protein